MNKEELTEAVDYAMAESKRALKAYCDENEEENEEDEDGALTYFVYCVERLKDAWQTLEEYEKECSHDRRIHP
jgi:hypothetical protein